MEVASKPVENSLAGRPLPASASSAACTTHEVELTSRILARVEQLTKPALLSPRWAFLGTSKAMRRLAGEPAELLAALQGEFSSEALLAARVVVPNFNNTLQLSHVFGDAKSSFVLRRDSERSPIDAVSARGVLSTDEPPWLRLAAERTESTDSVEQPVLLAMSDADVLVLYRLGLSYTPAAGMPNATGERIRALFAARPRERQQRKHQLTVAAWHLAQSRRAPSPATLMLLKRTMKIGRAYGVDPGVLFDVWLPSAKEFGAIQDALEFKDYRLAVRAIKASLKNSRLSPAEAVRALEDREQPSFGAARARLLQTVRRSAIVPGISDATADLAKFKRAFFAAVVEKFLATETNDPWEAWLAMRAADLAEAWFNYLDVVSAAGKLAVGNYPGDIDQIDRRLLDERLRIGDAVEKLYRLRPRRK